MRAIVDPILRHTDVDLIGTASGWRVGAGLVQTFEGGRRRRNDEFAARWRDVLETKKQSPNTGARANSTLHK